MAGVAKQRTGDGTAHGTIGIEGWAITTADFTGALTELIQLE
ncbi:MAG TPA: hypothetical protein VET27_07390 [Mycobacterium sp.]|nr:hypothetical protein [Mycobacterium sp.]